jgi:DNA ligase (NAD+)
MTNKLKNMSICITGSTNIKRSELKKIIMDNGGSFVSTVNKICTHLIIADPESTTIKANNARELGVQLISEEQFLDMVS